jgi:hypothetical protein
MSAWSNNKNVCFSSKLRVFQNYEILIYQQNGPVIQANSILNIVTHVPTAKQRLDKHLPAEIDSG